MPVIKNLLFKGGGVKGLAYAGALQVLAEMGHLNTVEHVAGASAGAITALILGLGYNVSEITKMLDIDIRQFEDGITIAKPLTVLTTFGANPGKAFRKWITGKIKEKLGKENANFEDLHNHVLTQSTNSNSGRFVDVHFIGANLSQGRAEIFSFYTTPKMPLADAVRISMSIPIFFEPKIYQKDAKGEFVYDKAGNLMTDKKGDMYVDGGLADNYPIDLFDNSYSNPHTLGFRVDSSKDLARVQKKSVPSVVISGFKEYGAAIWETASSAQSKHQEVDNFRTIYIDTGNISATQFVLTDAEKKDLEKAGREATKRFFIQQFDNPHAQDLGSVRVSDKFRQFKLDRYQLYHKAHTICCNLETSEGGRVQLVFKPLPQISWWVLQDKINKYYHRLLGQIGIQSLSHLKRPLSLGGEQILVLTLNKELMLELKNWLKKSQLHAKVSSSFIAENECVTLETMNQEARPLWMMRKDDNAALKSSLFQYISMGTVAEVNNLLREGISLEWTDNKGNTPLHIAAKVEGLSMGYSLHAQLVMDALNQALQRR